ncbi:MAG: PAS domain-containing protein [Thioalkalivibrio sp.]|nr:PAS domain-containing protein [Thioalkalivibrio sp.]
MTARKKSRATPTPAPLDAVGSAAKSPAAEPTPAQDAPDDTGTGFPVVGIGASAGGLAAFEAFLSGMPAGTDPGMAFVLVQHLDPNHKSLLSELVQRYTRLQVFEVQDGMTVAPNCAYIIPPNRDMALLNGKLQLMEPAAPRGRRLPIDFFFRSLAQDRHEKAVCVVLSGTGSDGTLGLRAIKGEGGMAMVQTPATTEFDGMPRSALATGLVDFELAPAEMIKQLMAYVAHAGDHGRNRARVPSSQVENDLRKVFVLLRAQTSHDFSQYKPSTIHRRIERRLAVHQLASLGEYITFLQQSPTEVDALFRDLLIGVTSFFRDPEVFGALGTDALPKLLANREPGAAIRVWATGCSTGEEPYSLAILLHELNEDLKQGFKIQIFATDIDGQAVATARAGLYPPNVASDISPERLSRFFTREAEGGSYRVNKAIRDMLVFSEHNVLKDPPFSKLDLISCRNLLIYLDVELQQRVLHLFHYALNPTGVLFLGTSETVGESGDLFAVLDRKAKIYRRKEGMPGAHRPAFVRFPPPRPRGGALVGHMTGHRATGGKMPLRELTQQALLQQFAPAAAALVNSQGDILYLHGRTGRFLEHAPGEVGVSNIVKMAREGLSRDLTNALHRASSTLEPVHCPGLRVRLDGGVAAVDLVVSPVTSVPGGVNEPLLHLVTLAESPQSADAPTDATAEPPDQDAPSDPIDESDPRYLALRQELRANEEYLQTANEEMETANEDLKSSNEEMQSVNEELQSTNEELETSKEELQSVNEELATVNVELQAKVADLSRVNNDMNNLMAGSNIGTVFVDHKLRILRFTPASTRIINLIESDVGRPVSHLVSNLVGYDRLVEDVQLVLDTLAPTEVEVRTKAGLWFSMRIQPYRTLENVIEGAVITFVEITKLKQIQAAAQESESCFRQIARSVPQLIWTCRPDGHCDYLGPQWAEFTGIAEAEPTATGWLDRIHPEDRAAFMDAWNRSLATGEPLATAVRLRDRRDAYHRFNATATALRDDAGRIVKWFGLCSEVQEATGEDR